MQIVGSFLERFKHLQAPERSVRKATKEAVSDVLSGVMLTDDCIKIQRESILYLSPSSIIKSAIFENKQTIISRINNILSKEQIKEIR